MNLQTEQLLLQGGAGYIEALRDHPTGPSQGLACICHPHPLFGGTMNNKVVQTLARACVQSGWTAVRFNFRGVGASEGQFDAGLGEASDLLAIIDQLAPVPGNLALAGFSFGAFVASRAVSLVQGKHRLVKLVLVGAAVSRFEMAPIDPELHDRLLVVHGEVDETVELAHVFNWARPQAVPITVLPGCDHFFHGQLPLLRQVVVRHLQAP